MTMRCYKYQIEVVIEVVIERIIECSSQCYRISIDKKMGPTHIHDFLVCRADISVIVKFTTVHPEPFHIAVDPGSRSSRYTRVLFMKWCRNNLVNQRVRVATDATTELLQRGWVCVIQVILSDDEIQRRTSRKILFLELFRYQDRRNELINTFLMDHSQQ